MFDFLCILKSVKKAGAALTIMTALVALAVSTLAYKTSAHFAHERESARISRELAALAVNFEGAAYFVNKADIRRLPLFTLEFKWGELVAVDSLSAPSKILRLAGETESSLENLIPKGATFDNTSGLLEIGDKLLFFERLKGEGDAALLYIVIHNNLQPSFFYESFPFYILLFLTVAGSGLLFIALHITSLLKAVTVLQKGVDHAVYGEFAPLEMSAPCAELALLCGAFNEKMREFNSSHKFIDTDSPFKEEIVSRLSLHKERIDKIASLRLEKHNFSIGKLRKENAFLEERASILRVIWKGCLPSAATTTLMRGFLTLWRHDLAVSIIKLREAVRSPNKNVPPELALIKVTSCLYTVKEELYEFMEIIQKSEECSSFSTPKFYERLTHYLRVYEGTNIGISTSFSVGTDAESMFYGFKFYYIKALFFLLGEITAFLTKTKKEGATLLLHVIFKEEKLTVIIEDNAGEALVAEGGDMERGEDPLFTVYKENLAEHFGTLEILNVLHGRRYKLEFSALGVRYGL